MVEISSSTIPTRIGLTVMVYFPLSLPFMGASLVPSGRSLRKEMGVEVIVKCSDTLEIKSPVVRAGS